MRPVLVRQNKSLSPDIMDVCQVFCCSLSPFTVFPTLEVFLNWRCLPVLGPEVCTSSWQSCGLSGGYLFSWRNKVQVSQTYPNCAPSLYRNWNFLCIAEACANLVINPPKYDEAATTKNTEKGITPILFPRIVGLELSMPQKYWQFDGIYLKTFILFFSTFQKIPVNKIQ